MEKEKIRDQRPEVPFHIGVLAELTKEKVKTEIVCLLFGLVALFALVSAIIADSKGVEIVALDNTGRQAKLEKLANYDYWDSHIQSFALDFIAVYFDKDPLSVKPMTERAFKMMSDQLRERESPKAINEFYSIIQSNLRVLSEVRSMELDAQDRFTVNVIAERTTRGMQNGNEWEKKEIVRYRLHLAPEQRSLANQFKGLRVRDFSVEVI